MHVVHGGTSIVADFGVNTPLRRKISKGHTRGREILAASVHTELDMIEGPIRRKA